MDHDGLETDDARRVVVTVKDTVAVLLVNGKPAGQAYDQAAEYVRTALNPFRRRQRPADEHVVARPKVINETQFADEGLGDLTPYDCVFLCDVPLFTEARCTACSTTSAAAAASSSSSATAWTSPLQRHAFRAGVGLLPARLVEKQSTTMRTIRIKLTPESDVEREAGVQAVHRLPAREMLLAAHFH